jgi:hypothetical protein
MIIWSTSCNCQVSVSRRQQPAWKLYDEKSSTEEGGVGGQLRSKTIECLWTYLTFPISLHSYTCYALLLTRHQQQRTTRHFCHRSQENMTNACSFSLWFKQHAAKKNILVLTLLINLWHLLFYIWLINISVRWYRLLFVLATFFENS